jgi:deoxyadenosine/deoxycytidine kinase
MIIAISGTHCTGKTTLVEELKKLPEFEKATFLKSTGKGLQNLSLKINEEGNFLTQFYIICRDIQQLIENRHKDLVILDRCHWDTYAYSKYLFQQGRITDEQLRLLGDLVTSIDKIIPLDEMFILTPSFELKKGDERSMDLKFQSEVQDIFSILFEGCSEVLPERTEDRINRIKEYLNL